MSWSPLALVMVQTDISQMNPWNTVNAATQ